MAIDGRINIDVLFHDTDGTASLKVVSLEDSTAYTSGKVAVVSGTVGTSQQSIVISDYRDAAGQQVSFSGITRVAIQSSDREVRYLMSSSPENIGLISIGRLAVGDINPVFAALTNHRIRTTAGTASYTLVLYGT
jgi:hypothetical protein